MSLKIYLDDCAFAHRLRQLLIEAGHEVQVPAEVDPPLTGASDEVHFAHAQTTGQIILTLNPKDFLVLQQKSPRSPGIFAVYQDNDPSRDMSYADIVRAIANLESTGAPIAGGFWALNGYRW
ncbi:MAG: DUF5615 family PIN-like protein [Anaerolineae bacterium]|nr:DUF5615 family PIN-like protein [Anaerolineae bacterium]